MNSTNDNNTSTNTLLPINLAKEARIIDTVEELMASLERLNGLRWMPLEASHTRLTGWGPAGGRKVVPHSRIVKAWVADTTAPRRGAGYRPATISLGGFNGAYQLLHTRSYWDSEHNCFQSHAWEVEIAQADEVAAALLGLLVG